VGRSVGRGRFVGGTGSFAGTVGCRHAYPLRVRIPLVAIGIAFVAWLVAVAALILAGRKVEAKQLGRLLRTSPRCSEACSTIHGFQADPRSWWRSRPRGWSR